MRFRSRRRQLEHIQPSLQAVGSAYRFGASNENGKLASTEWPDALGLSWAALLIGVLPVVTALVRGGPWGAEPTIGLALSSLGAVGLGRYYACAARDWARRRTRRQGQTS